MFGGRAEGRRDASRDHDLQVAGNGGRGRGGRAPGVRARVGADRRGIVVVGATSLAPLRPALLHHLGIACGFGDILRAALRTSAPRRGAAPPRSAQLACASARSRSGLDDLRSTRQRPADELGGFTARRRVLARSSSRHPSSVSPARPTPSHSYHMTMMRLRPVVAAAVAAVAWLAIAAPAFGQTRASCAIAPPISPTTSTMTRRSSCSGRRSRWSPTNPANHRALAVDDLAQHPLPARRRHRRSLSRQLHPERASTLKSPPAELDAEFNRESAKAIELSESAEPAARPKDAHAHLDLGTSLGLQATYIASVEGRLMAGFKAARRSYDECEQALALDPPARSRRWSSAPTATSSRRCRCRCG